MADLSLKGLDDGLMTKVKVSALDARMTLRAFVVKILEMAVEDEAGRNGMRVRGSVESGAIRQRAKGTGESSKALSTAHVETRPPDQSGAVDRGTKANRGREGKGQETAVTLTGERSEHDVKNCRVYRCGQCVAAGKKF